MSVVQCDKESDSAKQQGHRKLHWSDCVSCTHWLRLCFLMLLLYQVTDVLMVSLR